MEQKIEIDLIPLTSVALIVLLMLMVISPHISQTTIDINLPLSKTSEDSKIKRIAITLGRDGRIEVSGDEVKFFELKQFLTKKLLAEPENIILIRADKKLLYSDVEPILNIVRESGAKRIVIATEKDISKGQY